MQRQPESEVNAEQILERLRSFFGRLRFGGGGGSFLYIVLGALAVAAVIWGARGFYTVSTVGGEVGVLRLLGKFQGETQPGLHWFWPSPVGSRVIVPADERRSLELGFRGGQTIPEESLMITGDENIVDVQLLVQYNIKSPRDFLFNVVDPEGVTLRDVAETALRQVVGSRPIDDVLTDRKDEVQDDTKALLQLLLDEYKTGILVTEVKLQNVNPPEAVQDAFDDVVKAKEDKETIINLADAYKEDILPRAQGEAARLRQAAEAFKAERVNLATGQADRFTAILIEYRNSKDVTRQRLYLEAMEEILPGITKVILNPGAGVLPILPLQGVFPIPSPQAEGQR
jgi:membrane protease subunit HflK